MKKSIFTILILTIVLSIQAQQKKTPLQEHINAGKEAYNKFADKKNHEIIKNNKTSKSYIIGDTEIFWKWDFTDMPPAWVQEPATCRAVGDNSYVFVADNQWNNNMNQTDVDEVLFRLEEETLNSSEYGIIEMDTTYFGLIPDELDNDPKVIFFFSALGSYNGTVFDGYFSAYNQMTEEEAQLEGAHSNKCEMLYMSCDPVNPTASSTLSVLSHELQHLIHWGYDTNEETWVDEGCAELAMVIYGYPDPIIYFPSNPNNNLIVWDQQFSDYVQTMLFFTYLSEQYGVEIIKEIVANPENSVTGINTVLSNNGIAESFTDIFNNWTIANFLDDTDFDNGKYGYEIFNLPNFSYNTYSNLPTDTSKNIYDCSAIYHNLPLDFEEIEIKVSTDDTGNSILHLLAYEDGTIKEIFTDDGDLIMNFTQPDLYTLSDLILVTANQRTSNDSTDFSINIFDPTVDINELEDNSINICPNPVNDFVTISLKPEKPIKFFVEITDLNGKIIKRIYTDRQIISINTSTYSSGLYFIKIKTDKKTIVRKFIVER